MINKVSKKHTKEEVLSLFEPLIQDWFNSKFKDLTPPQAYAIPLIHARKNVLVSSPTGSGKTMTAFLSIINELLNLDKKGLLEDRIYCVYISPLKALANDINRNLRAPLSEISTFAAQKGMKLPGIRIAVRSGDTPPSERQRMVREPPHIFITTPESLALVLSTKKFRPKFAQVEWVIVDEIHELCSSKRGVLLSLTLERLQEYVEKEFVRIGLSATQAPIEEIAKFLVGYGNDNKLRDVSIVEIKTQKDLDLSVLCPVDDMTLLPYEYVNAKMYDKLCDLIGKHRTTLIFTNTRSGTESVAYKLKEKGIEGEVEAHHGSLGRCIRLDVEERLKNGDLKCVISSTSLELGIDIGYIDLVCQIGSPKSIAKGLQRVGRAGHAVGDVSTGRFVVFDNDDLVECTVLVKNAYDYKIDRIAIPTNSLDVLAQSIVGMSLEKRWLAEDCLKTVRRSYCYHNLPEDDFYNILNYLSSRDEYERVYSKIWFDREECTFGRKRGCRMIYYLNIGTIPEECDYSVISTKGIQLGKLSEKFVERLTIGDIFVLGAKTYEFIGCKGMAVYVRDAGGRRPTIPSWTGEMLPRSFDLSIEIGKFRECIFAKLKSESAEKIQDWLMKNYYIDSGSAKTVVSYFKEQYATYPYGLTHDNLLIEGYIDARGNYNIIFHYCFGRRTNDALARAYAYALSTKYNCAVRISVLDDSFMLTSTKRIPLQGLEKILTTSNFEPLLRKAVKGTELFKQRFRHCATRSFMILRNYKGKEISVSRQQNRSAKILELISELENFPVVKETYNEILTQVLDIANAKKIVSGIENSTIKVAYKDYDTVATPFAHNVILAGVSDIILMEDRTALLKELHKQVLAKILPPEELVKVRFQPEIVEAYFKSKYKLVIAAESVLQLLKNAPAMNLFVQKGFSIYDFTQQKNYSKLRKLCLKLFNAGELVAIWRGGTFYIHKDDLPYYATLYAKQMKIDATNSKIVSEIKNSDGITLKKIASRLKLSKRKVDKVLRALEPTYNIYKRRFTSKNEAVWCWRELEKVDELKALEQIVCKELAYKGPKTVTELSTELMLEDTKVDRILKILVAEGIVKEDFFTLPEKQYMLATDSYRIALCTEQSFKSVEYEHLLNALTNDYKCNSIEQYFERFKCVQNPIDILCLSPGFRYTDWQEFEKNLYYGRFVGSRLRYVLRKDVPLYITAYRSEELTEFDKRVLNALKNTEGLKIQDLIAIFGSANAKLVRASIANLERNLYIHRKIEQNNEETVYLPLSEEKLGISFLEAAEMIISDFINSRLAVSVDAITAHTNFTPEVVQKIVDKLVDTKRFFYLNVRGQNAQKFVATNTLFEILEKVPEENVTLISPTSPIADAIGLENFEYIVLKNGLQIGSIDMILREDYIDILNIQIENDNFLDDFLELIDKLLSFYNGGGKEGVCVRAINRLDIPLVEKNIVLKFMMNGYVSVHDMLSKGNFVNLKMDFTKLLNYIFWKQHVHPATKLRTTLDCISKMRYLKSDYEAGLRTEVHIPLKKLYRYGKVLDAFLMQGQFYCTYVECMLTKAIRTHHFDDNTSLVLKVLKHSKNGLSRKELFEECPLGWGSFLESIQKLWKSTCIAKKHNRYVAIEDYKQNRRILLKLFLKDFIDNFGFLNAELIANYLQNALNKNEINACLQEFVKEGLLVRGFFIDDRTIYYLPAEDFKKLSADLIPTFNTTFILTPTDRIAVYLQNWFVQMLGKGLKHIVFQGPNPIGAFKGVIRRHIFVVKEPINTQAEFEALQQFCKKWYLKISSFQPKPVPAE